MYCSEQVVSTKLTSKFGCAENVLKKLFCCERLAVDVLQLLHRSRLKVKNRDLDALWMSSVCGVAHLASS